MSITNISTTTATNLYAGSTAAGNAPAAPAASPSQVAAPSVESSKAKPVDRKEVENAVKHIESFVHTAANNLQFSIDDQTGMTIVKVTDASTKEVIRQIPSDEILAIARALDRFHGLLIESKA